MGILTAVRFAEFYVDYYWALANGTDSSLRVDMGR